MFENPTRGRQTRNFTTNVPKILDLKSSSQQIFSEKLTLGAPVQQKNEESRKFGTYGVSYFTQGPNVLYIGAMKAANNFFLGPSSAYFSFPPRLNPGDEVWKQFHNFTTNKTAENQISWNKACETFQNQFLELTRIFPYRTDLSKARVFFFFFCSQRSIPQTFMTTESLLYATITLSLYW